jgi:hypothetical protein
MQENEDVGHISKGQLHSECNEDTGCGIKYEIEGSGQIVELERDEAVIIPDAFENQCFTDSFCKRPNEYKITGTIAQIASAINQLGGGADFSSGAKVWKNGRKMKSPRLTVRNSRRNPKKLQAGSVVINRTNMLNPKVMTFEGTAYQIASDINSFGGNGVKLMEDGGSLDMGTGTELDKGGKVATETKREDQLFATMFDRQLFKSGGQIELTKKKMAKVIEDAIKRQNAFAELKRIRKEDSLPLQIATMVSNPIEQMSLVPEQRKQLVDWALKPENGVKFIVAFSGGKDSVAMVLKLMFEYNVPASQIELWHHEVDGFGENLWDWKCTPSYCEAFAEAFNLKLLYSYREGGITREILKGKDSPQVSGDILFQSEPNGEFHRSKSSGTPNVRMMFPAVVSTLMTRWCSGLVKIDVMKRALNNIPELSKTGQVVICTGERRYEGGNRATYMEIEPYNFAHSKNMITWRPVIDMTEQEVWDLYEEFGIQPHPAYELNWGRCSCQTCIFNSSNYWASIKEISPEKIEKIAELEKITGRTLYNEKTKDGKMKTIGDKVSAGTSLISPEAKARWQKEATGKFVSPIFLPPNEWRLPDGAFQGENCGAT